MLTIEAPVEQPYEGKIFRHWMQHWSLIVNVNTIDSVRDHRPITILHGFPVDQPEQTDFTLDQWKSWVFDRVLDVHFHELAEFYRVGTVRPYKPEHGPDGDPYRDPRLVLRGSDGN